MDWLSVVRTVLSKVVTTVGCLAALKAKMKVHNWVDYSVWRKVL